MSTPVPSASPDPSEGDHLKAKALQKLAQARTLLDSARSDMCNLEGHGYCKAYEEVGAFDEKLGKLMSKYRSLKAPTGVFKL